MTNQEAPQAAQVRYGLLPAATVVALLDQCFAPGAYWLCTSPEAAAIGQLGAQEKAAELLAAWPQGRLFSTALEVRWAAAEDEHYQDERYQDEHDQNGHDQDEHYQLWLLSEAAITLPAGVALPPLGGPWQVGEPAPAIYLWGQFKAALNHWVEVRIPQLLRYPIAPAQRQEAAFAGIAHIDYAAPNGAVQFSRLTQVAPIGAAERE